MAYSVLEVRPLAGKIGAEIYGVDLRNADDGRMWSEIQRAYLEFHVLAIRGQQLTADDLMTVGRRFGQPVEFPFAKHLDGYRFIQEVIKDAAEVENFGNEWHSDAAYLEQPPSGTLLYAVEIPPKGGETIFANTRAAYDSLSTGMRAMVDPLVGVFNSEQKRKRSGSRADRYAAGIGGVMVPTPKPRVLEARHPIVRTHPETNRKAIYSSALHTVRFDGFTESESEPLILWLNNYCIQPEFSCRIRWEPGQLTVWDNRCTMHYAINDYHGYRRVMRNMMVNPEYPA